MDCYLPPPPTKSGPCLGVVGSSMWERACEGGENRLARISAAGDTGSRPEDGRVLGIGNLAIIRTLSPAQRQFPSKGAFLIQNGNLSHIQFDCINSRGNENPHVLSRQVYYIY